MDYRQATQEQTKDSPRYSKGQGCEEEEGRINDALPGGCGRWRHLGFCWIWDGLHVCTLPQWLSISCIGGGSKLEQWYDFNRTWPLQLNKGVCLSDIIVLLCVQELVLHAEVGSQDKVILWTRRTIGASKFPMRFSMMKDLHKGIGVSAKVFVSPVSGKATSRVLNVIHQDCIPFQSPLRYLPFASTISLRSIFVPQGRFLNSQVPLPLLYSSVIWRGVSIS